ncbi:hypothetical protein VN21_04580 [Paraclostridium benzoelyticum]|uniref:Polysaccharide biosynthesis protein n=1 Tax=Paraclostridium benzoelyticum TaxID=1629550 RepID=A0A0M3DIK3_9FIRM|nr:PssD/Cps14F family polysaccharide biosynthesis glycosyltransferase [Paraclostridium benzoelyticum]KKY02178.1 hypothetical protein VN21_04580 [Paraclostridium benzoelyticum]
MEKLKICFTSSSGGHFNQLLILSEKYNEFEKFFITEKTNFSQQELKNEKKFMFNVINRKEKNFKKKFIRLSLSIFKILFKERPDLIISTGALITVPVCYIGKILGSKVIFIESFAKVNSPTLSGKLVIKIADEFIVQWKELEREYNNENKVKYGGTIY